MKKYILLSLLAIIISLGFTIPAQAVILTYDAIPDPLGAHYNFTLDNNDQPSIFELFLKIPTPDVNLLSFSSPAGWGDGFGAGDPFHGDDGSGSFSEWFADFGAELSQGSSLAGFSFTSSQMLSNPIFFSFNQDTSFSHLAQRSSPVSAPIPEPATMLLFGPALLGLLVCKKKAGGRR